MAIRPLDGFTIGVTAASRHEEQEVLLRRRGASVVHGSAMRCELLAGRTLRRQTERIIQHPPDVLVVSTAAAMRLWFEAADRWALRARLTAALSTSYVVARGAKSVDAVNAAELTVWWQPPSETTKELVSYLESRTEDGRVAVLLDGTGAHDMADALAATHAELDKLAVYRWVPQEETRPALGLLEAACDHRVDALTFTAAPAVRHLLTLAAENDMLAPLRDAFSTTLLCACVGPIAARAVGDFGIANPLVPPRARLGSLVQAVSGRLSARRRVLTIDNRRATVQGCVAIVDGTQVKLSGRERALFDALAQRPGAVVPKARLAREVFGNPAYIARVDTTVSRLRRRLGPLGPAVRSTRSRGYWLDGAEIVSGV